jgi:hypothetical protein
MKHGPKSPIVPKPRSASVYTQGVREVDGGGVGGAGPAGAGLAGTMTDTGGGGGGGADLDLIRVILPLGASTTSFLSNLRRKSIPTKISVLCHSIIIRPTSDLPSKCNFPRHVSFVWVLPSAKVIGVVPLKMRPTGNASRIGSNRNPLNPVSIMAVNFVGLVTGPETEISMMGDPELLKEPVTLIAVAIPHFENSRRAYFDQMEKTLGILLL